MGKAFLIHWHKGEALAYSRMLEDWGWTVRYEHEDGARAGKSIKEEPPDVVVIYLSRLPSHGRETADYLKQMKATRHIPIIFVDGEPGKVQKVKERVPDGVFVTSATLKEILENYARRQD